MTGWSNYSLNGTPLGTLSAAGNFTGAMGIPTLESLGAVGDGLHTLGEHILVPSLAELLRARRS